MKKSIPNNELKLFNIANIQRVAEASESTAPKPSPIEGLSGWTISTCAAQRAGVDLVILECEAHSDTNPLHSGGDVFWLGYVAEGSIELLLGDSEGNTKSSRIVNRGDHLVFEPETFHGWVPGDQPAKILFIKTN